MENNQYTYAVARIRSKELSLLSKQFLEQLLAAKSYEDSLRLLQDKGWGGRSEKQTAAEILKDERDKIWDLLGELVEDMSVLDVFLLKNDYHNLKAAIKQKYTNTEVPNIYISYGTVDIDAINKAVEEKDFSQLPEYMQECAVEAYEVLMRTGDGQLCDIIIDKGALEAIYKTGRSSKNQLISMYAEFEVAKCNINIAVRGCNTRKGIDFFERAIVVCDSLDSEKLIEAALISQDAIYEYLKTTVYEDAIQALKNSFSAFELWCDNLVIEKIRPEKYNPFTIAPLVAYVIARENEIKVVRIILSGKLNSISDNVIRERLREMYV
ncbi:MAG: V-type ATPase subunit [Clostridiales bacterium]|nr:V-type ATPase subunit [Clostridiales bacterium]